MRVVRIVFTGKNLADVFNEPAVKLVMKDEDGKPMLVLWPQYVDGGSCIVMYGDIIEQRGDKWSVIRTSRNK